MIELLNTGAYLVNGIDIIPDTEEGRAELKARTGAVPCPADAAKETIAYGILKAVSYTHLTLPTTPYV